MSNNISIYVFLQFTVRSNTGVEVWSKTGQTETHSPNEKFSKDESKFCRAIAFSPDGRFLAWANGTKYGNTFEYYIIPRKK